MKLYKLKIFIGLFSIIILFLACSKEDVNPITEDNFQNHNQSLILQKGFLENWGQNLVGQHKFELSLTSLDINYNLLSDNFSGNGYIILINLYSSNPEAIENGNYVFSQSGEALTFDYSVISKDFNTIEETGEIFLISEGNVSVDHSSGQTTIEFSLKTDENKNIVGKFKGDLMNI